MMWEPSVVATQVEPYVTDYGIDIVSGGGKEAPWFHVFSNGQKMCTRNGNPKSVGL